MEELRSTEILDKEIQDDARRKSDRILKNAQMECDKVLEDMERRIEESRKEQSAYYAKKISDYKKDAEASVPLEKERFLVDFQNDAVNNAMKQYLDSLSGEKRLKIIETMITRFKNSLIGKKVNVTVSGFDKTDMKNLIEKILGKGSVLTCSTVENKGFTGCIIQSDDLTIKCRVTLEEKIAEIVDVYRNELATALFGGRLPE